MLNQAQIQHLNTLAQSLVQGRGEESECYAVFNEALYLHSTTVPLGSFQVFPQLRLRWKPEDPDDRRSLIPDLGIGRLLPDGNFHLQGGVEQKRMVPEMSELPAPDANFEMDVRLSFHAACQQAFDQVKAAIKNGHFPNDKRIQWVVAVGPYFIIKECGPFNEEDLGTRGHRPNPSGDFNVAEFLTALQRASYRPLGTPIYRIGTQEAYC